MKIQIKSFALGFGFACLSLALAIGLFLTYPLDIGRNAPVVREQTLPSGKTVVVTSFDLLWGWSMRSAEAAMMLLGLSMSHPRLKETWPRWTGRLQKCLS